MESKEVQTRVGAQGGAAGLGAELTASGARRPYVKPVIESGEAFERVQLASGCNEGVEDCEIPC